MVACVALGGRGESWGTGSPLGLPSQGGVGAAEPQEATCKEPKCAVHKDRGINFGQTVGVR